MSNFTNLNFFFNPPIDLRFFTNFNSSGFRECAKTNFNESKSLLQITLKQVTNSQSMAAENFNQSTT